MFGQNPQVMGTTDAVYKPRTQALTDSEGAHPTHTLIPDFHPPDLRESKFLLFKLLRPWLCYCSSPSHTINTHPQMQSHAFLPPACPQPSAQGKCSPEELHNFTCFSLPQNHSLQSCPGIQNLKTEYKISGKSVNILLVFFF